MNIHLLHLNQTLAPHPMACLSDESWARLPNMLSKRLSIKEEKQNGEAETNSLASDPVVFPFEKVFPVYAMGYSKPDFDLDSVVSAANSRDPIWDAVKEEAKLEVPALLYR